MDLAVLCYVEPKLAPTDGIQFRRTFNPPLHGSPPPLTFHPITLHPITLHPYRSACGIGVASKKTIKNGGQFS